MKKQEEKKQIVLNLSLPLIELPDNQVYDCNHYPESGMYFVKAGDGCFHIAEVNKEDNNNWHNPLPGNVGNCLLEQQAVLSMKDIIEEKLHRLEEVVISSMQQTADCIEGNCKTIASKIENLWDKCEEKDVSIQDIPQTVVKLLNDQQPHQSAKGIGFVSQEALVEIIRTIK
jgi:hypothetical protein